MKLDCKKIIWFDNLAMYLNVSHNYLGKLFNSCSLMKRKYYTIEHLQFLADNLHPGNVRKTILIKNLKEFIKEFKEDNI